MFDKLGLRHRFFRPLYRRVLTVAVITGWGGVELWLGNVGWAVGFFVIAALCAVEFFVLFDPQNYGDEDG
ncbi:MAG: hypothetical protein AAGA87_12080 [Pseudomonadota bacterium]